jgi:hypothetical protein
LLQSGLFGFLDLAVVRGLGTSICRFWELQSLVFWLGCGDLDTISGFGPSLHLTLALVWFANLQLGA